MRDEMINVQRKWVRREYYRRCAELAQVLYNENTEPFKNVRKVFRQIIRRNRAVRNTMHRKYLDTGEHIVSNRKEITNKRLKDGDKFFSFPFRRMERSKAECIADTPGPGVSRRSEKVTLRTMRRKNAGRANGKSRRKVLMTLLSRGPCTKFNTIIRRGNIKLKGGGIESEKEYPYSVRRRRGKESLQTKLWRKSEGRKASHRFKRLEDIRRQTTDSWKTFLKTIGNVGIMVKGTPEAGGFGTNN